jgi:probable HAF family extracellular repeat protein
VTELGTLGGCCGRAGGINEAGQIVGQSSTDHSDLFAVLWDQGSVTNLGTLSGVPGGTSISWDINAGGQAVGESTTDTYARHAVLWTTPVVPVHDVAVSVGGGPLDVEVGTPVSFFVSLRNVGNQLETVNVTTYAGSVAIDARTVSDLPAYDFADWTYTWDTTNVTPGEYPMRAVADPVPGETDLADNDYTGPVVHVHAPLAARVSATPSATDVGITISFSCDVEDYAAPFGPYTYAWDFGDGGTATGAVVTHAYATPGTMTVSCHVTDNDGSTATGWMGIVIYPTPSVTASVEPSTAPPGTEVRFHATTTGGSGGFTYSWGFGDSSSAEGADVTHAYSEAGRYTAIVTVRDSAGGIASNTVGVTIAGAAAPLRVQASTTPFVTDVGRAVSFTCAASDGTPPYTFAWEFGDDLGGPGATATHAYAEAGTKTATCTVTDALGGTESAAVAIEVNSIPTVTASADRQAASPGTPVNFVAVARGGSGGYMYSWGFGDGDSATGSEVSHTYTAPGQYTVVVTVQDSVGGSSNTFALAVSVTSVTATAVVSTASATVGDPITLQAIAAGGAGGPYVFSWDFGDGTPLGTGARVTHTYAAPGTFTPRVTATDAAGASTEIVLPTIQVSAPPTAPVGASGTDSTQLLALVLIGAAVAGISAGLVARRRRRL